MEIRVIFGDGTPAQVTGYTHELVNRRLADAGRILMMLPVNKKRRPGEARAAWPDEVQTYFDGIFDRTAEIEGQDRDIAFSPFLDEEGRKEALEHLAEDKREEHREALERLRSVTRMHTSIGNDRRLGEALEWLLLIRQSHWRKVVAMRMLTRTNSAGLRKPVFSWQNIAVAFGSKKTTVRHWHDRGIQTIVNGLAQEQ